MRVEVITTGTELLLGEIVNENFVYLARELNQRGFDVLYQTTVGDNPGRIKEALRLAASRADIVIPGRHHEGRGGRVLRCTALYEPGGVEPHPGTVVAPECLHHQQQ